MIDQSSSGAVNRNRFNKPHEQPPPQEHATATATTTSNDMAAERRGLRPMRVDLPEETPTSEHPPISALFLIYFEPRKGYCISWKRSTSGIDLEGVVEYKSLPSGLHTVEEDLIYFVHGQYAGLSAFVNAVSSEESRKARMIAVGVLVPLSFGRLGRSWKHAENLKSLAQQLVVNISKTEILEGYWESHKADAKRAGANSDSTIDSPSSLVRFKSVGIEPGKKLGHGRTRSASDGTALLSHSLSAHHPAWSLIPLLDTFGPLIFPIYRAALLRKRILISCHAPVQEACDFVYDISVLSNTPLAVTNILSSTAPSQRLKPLFNIGVHDIPSLEDDLRASQAMPATPALDGQEYDIDEAGQGWVACTTDGILATKVALYDVLITLPPSYSADARAKIWPKITLASGEELKASQRDLRRYRALRWGLSRSESRGNTFTEEVATPRPRSSSTFPPYDDPSALDIPDTDTIVEPLSWPALAYTGFLWWASAGEKRLMQEEEAEQDRSLLADISDKEALPTSRSPRPKVNRRPNQYYNAEPEMAIIAYFHRLTTLILSSLSDLVDATDSEDYDDVIPILNSSSSTSVQENEDPEILIGEDVVERMGLDVWSKGDQKFVRDVVALYFGRRGAVEGRSIDVCGVSIC